MALPSWRWPRGGLPKDAGSPPKARAAQLIPNLIYVLVGTALVIPMLVLLVSGFRVIPWFHSGVTLIPQSFVASLQESPSRLVKGFASIAEEASRPAGVVLIIAGLGALFYLAGETFRLGKIARERMFVVFILTFFSLLFWSFFEQAGSSLNNFTDRNIDRVTEAQSRSRRRMLAQPSAAFADRSQRRTAGRALAAHAGVSGPG